MLVVTCLSATLLLYMGRSTIFLLLLKSGTEPVQEWAREKLGRLGSVAVPGLIRALRDEDAGIRLHAIIALHRLGDDAAPAVREIIEATRDEDIFVRRNSVGVLRDLGPLAVGAIPRLVELFADLKEDSVVRKDAAWALTEMGPTGLRALIGLLDAEDPLVRMDTVWALGSFGPVTAPAIDALTSALSDRDERVRKAASEALGALRPGTGQ